MLARLYDKLIFAGGLLILLASITVAYLQRDAVARIEGPISSPVPRGGPYEAEPITSTAPSTTETWPAPVAQRSGSDWLYDVFTPPTIYYNTQTKAFTVTAPVYAPTTEVATTETVAPVVEKPFAIYLVSTQPEDFRLQLVGYIGEGANARGTFENIVTGEVSVAVAGRRYADLDVVVKTLEVTQVQVATAGDQPIFEPRATAVIIDERSGQEITLDARTRQPVPGTKLAVLRTVAGNTTRRLKIGESWSVAGHTYTVRDVSLDPSEVELAQTGGDLTTPDVRRLKPGAPPPPAAAEAAAPEFPGQPGVRPPPGGPRPGGPRPPPPGSRPPGL